LKTLTLLETRFKNKILIVLGFGIRFQTPELCRLWAEQTNLDEEDDEYFISDRLSFYKLRDGENVMSTSENENQFCAIQ